MSLIQRRRAWARRFIAPAPDSPIYGSTEWEAMPEGPDKWASAIRAAEAWAREFDEFEDRVRAELDHAPVAAKRAEDAEYVERRDAHRREWSERSWRPHPANRRAS